MAYYITLKELTKYFNYINKKCYGGRIPKYKVKWHKTLWKFGYLGECDHFNHIISIAKELRVIVRIAKSTVVHETVHAALPYGIGHGKKFQKEMLRLAKKGIFKQLW